MPYVNNAPGVVLIDFYADWCGPCRKQGQLLKELKPLAIEKKASVIKVNVDNHPELADLFRIQSLPTIVVVQSKKIVDRQVGMTGKDKIVSLISQTSR